MESKHLITRPLARMAVCQPSLEFVCQGALLANQGACYLKSHSCNTNRPSGPVGPFCPVGLFFAVLEEASLFKRSMSFFPLALGQLPGAQQGIRKRSSASFPSPGNRPSIAQEPLAASIWPKRARRWRHKARLLLERPEGDPHFKGGPAIQDTSVF